VVATSIVATITSAGFGAGGGSILAGDGIGIGRAGLTVSLA
jgi:hypothetical protein